MTNSPSQPWHNANLRQDNELENTNPIPVKAGEFTFGPTGHRDGISVSSLTKMLTEMWSPMNRPSGSPSVI